MMFKKYGEYKLDPCPFCDNSATKRNNQGVPVCHKHSLTELPETITCKCGRYLELKTGKFGNYYSCIQCGNINIKRYLDIYGKFKEI